MPNEVDTFIAQFESLAEEAGYQPDAQPTLTLFALKLPGSMVNHIYKVVRPQTFQDWADVARQFHRDNIAVQNLRSISEDFGGRNKGGGKKGGMTASQLAALLKVKLPLPDPNAMDTRADRSRSWCYEHRPLGKRFKRHVTVGITPDRFKRVTSHLTSDRNTLTNTRYSGTPKSCNHNDTTGKWCHSTLFSHWIISRS